MRSKNHESIVVDWQESKIKNANCVLAGVVVVLFIEL